MTAEPTTATPASADLTQPLAISTDVRVDLDPTVLAARLPAGFRLGAATSSYQIEGAEEADGRGLSIWDTFSRAPGRVHLAQTGAVAIDHYHRLEEDVALMADLGLESYRFSVAWPRIIPDGDGAVEPRGLAFYIRLVDLLIQAGIEPVVTLYHWDLPQALQDRGGWANRETVHAFARYARVVQEALGEKVTVWTTINEPWCAAYLGYGNGVHAPGITDPRTAMRAAHHLLLAHGVATQRMREAAPEYSYGIVPNLYPVYPATQDPADVAAADTIDALQNRQWLDPLLLGRYPEEITRTQRRFGADSAILPGDLEQIAQPLDLLGVNYYSQHHVAAEPNPVPRYNTEHPGSEHVRWVRGEGPLTDMEWTIEPHGLRDILIRLSRDYSAPPLFVTENGAAFPDVVADDGSIQDADRRQFLAAHISAVAEAIEAGANVTGYTAWSLFDNYEWAFGYAKRFGIVHIDYETLQRTPKASAHWYRDLIAARRR